MNPEKSSTRRSFVKIKGHLFDTSQISKYPPPLIEGTLAQLRVDTRVNIPRSLGPPPSPSGPHMFRRKPWQEPYGYHEGRRRRRSHLDDVYRPNYDDDESVGYTRFESNAVENYDYGQYSKTQKWRPYPPVDQLRNRRPGYNNGRGRGRTNCEYRNQNLVVPDRQVKKIEIKLKESCSGSSKNAASPSENLKQISESDHKKEIESTNIVINTNSNNQKSHLTTSKECEAKTMTSEIATDKENDKVDSKTSTPESKDIQATDSNEDFLIVDECDESQILPNKDNDNNTQCKKSVEKTPSNIQESIKENKPVEDTKLPTENIKQVQNECDTSSKKSDTLKTPTKVSENHISGSKKTDVPALYPKKIDFSEKTIKKIECSNDTVLDISPSTKDSPKCDTQPAAYLTFRKIETLTHSGKSLETNTKADCNTTSTSSEGIPICTSNTEKIPSEIVLPLTPEKSSTSNGDIRTCTSNAEKLPSEIVLPLTPEKSNSSSDSTKVLDSFNTERSSNQLKDYNIEVLPTLGDNTRDVICGTSDTAELELPPTPKRVESLDLIAVLSLTSSVKGKESELSTTLELDLSENVSKSMLPLTPEKSNSCNSTIELESSINTAVLPGTPKTSNGAGIQRISPKREVSQDNILTPEETGNSNKSTIELKSSGEPDLEPPSTPKRAKLDNREPVLPFVNSNNSTIELTRSGEPDLEPPSTPKRAKLDDCEPVLSITPEGIKKSIVINLKRIPISKPVESSIIDIPKAAEENDCEIVSVSIVKTPEKTIESVPSAYSDSVQKSDKTDNLISNRASPSNKLSDSFNQTNMIKDSCGIGTNKLNEEDKSTDKTCDVYLEDVFILEEEIEKETARLDEVEHCPSSSDVTLNTRIENQSVISKPIKPNQLLSNTLIIDLTGNESDSSDTSKCLNNKNKNVSDKNKTIEFSPISSASNSPKVVDSKLSKNRTIELSSLSNSPKAVDSNLSENKTNEFSPVSSASNSPKVVDNNLSENKTIEFSPVSSATNSPKAVDNKLSKSRPELALPVNFERGSVGSRSNSPFSKMSSASDTPSKLSDDYLIKNIDTRGSFIGRSLLMFDDTNVVDMELASPSPSAIRSLHSDTLTDNPIGKTEDEITKDILDQLENFCDEMNLSRDSNEASDNENPDRNAEKPNITEQNTKSSEPSEETNNGSSVMSVAEDAGSLVKLKNPVQGSDSNKASDNEKPDKNSEEPSITEQNTKSSEPSKETINSISAMTVAEDVGSLVKLRKPVQGSDSNKASDNENPDKNSEDPSITEQTTKISKPSVMAVAEDVGSLVKLRKPVQGSDINKASDNEKPDRNSEEPRITEQNTKSSNPSKETNNSISVMTVAEDAESFVKLRKPVQGSDSNRVSDNEKPNRNSEEPNITEQNTKSSKPTKETNNGGSVMTVAEDAGSGVKLRKPVQESNKTVNKVLETSDASTKLVEKEKLNIFRNVKQSLLKTKSKSTKNIKSVKEHKGNQKLLETESKNPQTLSEDQSLLAVKSTNTHNTSDHTRLELKCANTANIADQNIFQIKSKNSDNVGHLIPLATSSKNTSSVSDDKKSTSQNSVAKKHNKESHRKKQEHHRHKKEKSRNAEKNSSEKKKDEQKREVHESNCSKEDEISKNTRGKQSDKRTSSDDLDYHKAINTINPDKLLSKCGQMLQQDKQKSVPSDLFRSKSCEPPVIAEPKRRTSLCIDLTNDDIEFTSFIPASNSDYKDDLLLLMCEPRDGELFRMNSKRKESEICDENSKSTKQSTESLTYDQPNEPGYGEVLRMNSKRKKSESSDENSKSTKQHTESLTDDQPNEPGDGELFRMNSNRKKSESCDENSKSTKQSTESLTDDQPNEPEDGELRMNSKRKKSESCDENSKSTKQSTVSLTDVQPNNTFNPILKRKKIMRLQSSDESEDDNEHKVVKSTCKRRKRMVIDSSEDEESTRTKPHKARKISEKSSSGSESSSRNEKKDNSKKPSDKHVPSERGKSESKDKEKRSSHKERRKHEGSSSHSATSPSSSSLKKPKESNKSSLSKDTKVVSSEFTSKQTPESVKKVDTEIKSSDERLTSEKKSNKDSKRKKTTSSVSQSVKKSSETTNSAVKVGPESVKHSDIPSVPSTLKDSKNKDKAEETKKTSPSEISLSFKPAHDVLSLNTANISSGKKHPEIKRSVSAFPGDSSSSTSHYKTVPVGKPKKPEFLTKADYEEKRNMQKISVPPIMDLDFLATVNVKKVRSRRITFDVQADNEKILQKITSYDKLSSIFGDEYVESDWEEQQQGVRNEQKQQTELVHDNKVPETAATTTKSKKFDKEPLKPTTKKINSDTHQKPKGTTQTTSAVATEMKKLEMQENQPKGDGASQNLKKPEIPHSKIVQLKKLSSSERRNSAPVFSNYKPDIATRKLLNIKKPTESVLQPSHMYESCLFQCDVLRFEKLHRISIVENDCTDKAFILEKITACDDSEVVQHLIQSSDCLENSRDDDVIEIPTQVPLIDLTDEGEPRADLTDQQTIDLTEDDQPKLEPEMPEPKLEDATLLNDTITLYRSEETTDVAEEVQAVVASISASTFLVDNNGKTSKETTPRKKDEKLDDTIPNTFEDLVRKLDLDKEDFKSDKKDAETDQSSTDLAVSTSLSENHQYDTSVPSETVTNIQSQSEVSSNLNSIEIAQTSPIPTISNDSASSLPVLQSINGNDNTTVNQNTAPVVTVSPQQNIPSERPGTNERIPVSINYMQPVLPTPPQYQMPDICRTTQNVLVQQNVAAHPLISPQQIVSHANINVQIQPSQVSPQNNHNQNQLPEIVRPCQNVPTQPYLISPQQNIYNRTTQNLLANSPQISPQNIAQAQTPLFVGGTSNSLVLPPHISPKQNTMNVNQEVLSNTPNTANVSMSHIVTNTSQVQNINAQLQRPVRNIAPRQNMPQCSPSNQENMEPPSTSQTVADSIRISLTNEDLANSAKIFAEYIPVYSALLKALETFRQIPASITPGRIVAETNFIRERIRTHARTLAVTLLNLNIKANVHLVHGSNQLIKTIKVYLNTEMNVPMTHLTVCVSMLDLMTPYCTDYSKNEFYLSLFSVLEYIREKMYRKAEENNISVEQSGCRLTISQKTELLSQMKEFNTIMMKHHELMSKQTQVQKPNNASTIQAQSQHSNVTLNTNDLPTVKTSGPPNMTPLRNYRNTRKKKTNPNQPTSQQSNASVTNINPMPTAHQSYNNPSVQQTINMCNTNQVISAPQNTIINQQAQYVGQSGRQQQMVRVHPPAQHMQCNNQLRPIRQPLAFNSCTSQQNVPSMANAFVGVAQPYYNPSVNSQRPVFNPGISFTPQVSSFVQRPTQQNHIPQCNVPSQMPPSRQNLQANSGSMPGTGGQIFATPGTQNMCVNPRNAQTVTQNQIFVTSSSQNVPVNSAFVSFPTLSNVNGFAVPNRNPTQVNNNANYSRCQAQNNTNNLPNCGVRPYRDTPRYEYQDVVRPNLAPFNNSPDRYAGDVSKTSQQDKNRNRSLLGELLASTSFNAATLSGKSSSELRYKVPPEYNKNTNQDSLSGRQTPLFRIPLPFTRPQNYVPDNTAPVATTNSVQNNLVKVKVFTPYTSPPPCQQSSTALTSNWSNNSPQTSIISPQMQPPSIHNIPSASVSDPNWTRHIFQSHTSRPYQSSTIVTMSNTSPITAVVTSPPPTQQCSTALASNNAYHITSNWSNNAPQTSTIVQRMQQPSIHNIPSASVSDPNWTVHTSQSHTSRPCQSSTVVTMSNTSPITAVASNWSNNTSHTSEVQASSQSSAVAEQRLGQTDQRSTVVHNDAVTSRTPEPVTTTARKEVKATSETEVAVVNVDSDSSETVSCISDGQGDKYNVEDGQITTVDLTWMDDLDVGDLQENLKFVFVKKEEQPDEADNAVNDIIVVPSPADSGISSPTYQNEQPETVYIEKICICGVDATYVCKCHNAWYCSQDCQLMDWESHQTTCQRLTADIRNNDEERIT